MTQQDSFSGTWHCRYWYPSNQHDGEDVSEYTAIIHQDGDTLVLASQPNAEGSYMIARIRVEGDLVTGTWQENTSPDGEFKGAMYSGAFQLLLDETQSTMEGKWVGVGQEEGKRKIYTGRWQITRAI